MTNRSSGAVLRQIHTLFTAGSYSGLSDRQLLDRFVARRDAVADLAFTALVERHGPMVLGVCRRILANSHDAEDAFQATFLVLVRQAHSIQIDGSLGRWLYGVAMRVAARARANARRRQACEQSGLNGIDAESREFSTTAGDLADLQAILAEEVCKLPVRFQAPIVLCDLEGLSHEEAAQSLGCPVGTIKSRLSRARARLRRGLIRRGLAPPDLLNVIPLFPSTVPHRLAEATSQAAQAWILGRLPPIQFVSASASALTEGVLWTMFLTKLKVAGAALLLIVAGSAVLVNQATAQKPPTQPGPARTTALMNAVGADEAPVLDDAIDLEMLERTWVDGLNRRDAAVVSRIIGDDFFSIDSAGNASTRASYLVDVGDGVFSNQPITLSEIKARIFAETAAVTSRIKIRTAPSSGRRTNVYVKRQGRWRCVSSHTSGLNMEACPAVNTTTGPERLFDQTTAGQPSIEPTRRAGSRSNCVTCHEPRRQATSPAGPPDVNVLYQPYTIQAPRPGQEMRIRPRFKCLVEKVYVKAGQTVKKGSALVDLFSVDLAAAKNDYLTAEVQTKNDQRILGVRRKLVAEKAISEQVWTDAQNLNEKSKLEFQIARDKLKFLGLDDEAIGLVGTEDGGQKARLTLRAPVDGTVTEVDAETGNLYDLEKVLMILGVASPGQAIQP